MSEYREYRKFSLTVRDLMASGQLEEARALVDAQVEIRANYLSVYASLSWAVRPTAEPNSRAQQPTSSPYSQPKQCLS